MVSESKATTEQYNRFPFC